MNPVTFAFATWVAMFPEFSALSPAQGQGYFMRASLVCANSTTNPAFGDGNLPTLLYLLTSHVAWLNCPKDGNGNPAATGTVASPLVGRISSAQEGSVNVQTEWDSKDVTSLEAWLIQTKYGAEFWAASAPYRTMRYLAQPTVVVPGPWPVPGGWGR